MFDASRQSFLVSALLCLLMAGLFVARYMLHPLPVEATCIEGMPFAASLAAFSALHPWLALLCGVFFVGWTMLLVARLASKYAPAGSRNYLPAQIFLISAVGVAVPGEALGAALAAWLLTLATRQGISSLHKGYKFTEVFRAGLYLGTLPLLYAPAAFVAIIVAAGTLFIYRRSGREAVVCLAGLLFPVAATGFIYWAFGAYADFIYRELWRCATTKTLPAIIEVIPLVGMAVAGLILFLACTGAGRALTNRRSIRKTPYKFAQHIALLLVVLAGSATIPGTSSVLISLVGVASALVMPYSFQGRWRVVSSIIYCLILIAIVAMNLSPFIGTSIL